MNYYNSDDADYLITYYIGLLKGKQIADRPPLKFSRIEKIDKGENGYVISVIAKRYKQVIIAGSDLTSVANRLGLEHPLAVLEKRKVI